MTESEKSPDINFTADDVERFWTVKAGRFAFSVFSKPNSQFLVEKSSSSEITEKDLEWLSLQAFEPTAASGKPRVSRGAVAKLARNGKSKIVVRRSRRGGLMHGLLCDRFFCPPNVSLSRSRPTTELVNLSLISSAGIGVGKPVAAFAKRDGWFYRGAIATEEIPDAENLLSIGYLQRNGANGQGRFISGCVNAGAAARRTLKAGFFHRDLHLGNVLLDSSDKVFLIDFDQVKLFDPVKDYRKHEKRTAERWIKSARKHQLYGAVEPFLFGLDASGDRVLTAGTDLGLTFQPERPKNVVIVLLGAIGDVVRALPLAVRLKKSWPDTRLSWAVEPKSYPVVKGHQSIDEIIVFKRHKGVKAYIEFVKTLRSKHFDLVLDLQRHFKSGLTSLLTGSRRRVGFHRTNAKEGNWLFNNEHVVAVSNYHPKIEHYQKFGDVLGLKRMDKLEFGVNPSTEQLSQSEKLVVASFREADIEFVEKEKRAALIIGSSWSSRFWCVEHYRELIRALFDKWAVVSILIGGPADSQFAAEIVADNEKLSVVNLTGKTALYELLAVFSSVRLAVGSDTGPTHIAAAIGLPVISLFGATSVKRAVPYGNDALALQSTLGCSPCYLRTCPGLNRLCMRKISPQMVIQKLEAVLGPSSF